MPGITVKGSAFELAPPTVTCAEYFGPGEIQYKPLGTVTVIELLLQLVTVAVYPLNATELLPWVAPKLLPVMVTEVPTAPDDGDRLAMLGGPCGVGWTVTAVLADTPAIVAVMLAVPAVMPVASPWEPGALPAVTIEELEELHAAAAVRFCTLPSGKVPLAVSCWLNPASTVGAAGRIVSETGAITFSIAEPLTSPAVAVKVAAPPVWAFTTPALPGELPTTATEGFEEPQITDCSVCVLPSLNVPVAVNC
jgi:hypothetical protein